MLTAIIIVMVIMILGSLGTIFAFSWAANNRQFEDLEHAAETIFDANEPNGEPTDPSIFYSTVKSSGKPTSARNPARALP